MSSIDNAGEKTRALSGYEKKYFKEYNLPYDEISHKLVKQPPYYFVVYVRKVGVSEPFKLTGIK